jgi:photosystem II stability/assembly factor-like uncharacterized protein
MKTFKIILALGLIILIAAGLLFPLPQPALAQEETPQPGSTHKTYLPIISKYKPPSPVQSYSIGPEGGTFTAVVVDPKDSSIIYLGTYGAGVYKSSDGGTSWTQKINGLANPLIQSLAISPQNSAILYAGTYNSGIYKSTDGGNSWANANAGVSGSLIVYDVEVDPSNPANVYFASRKSGSLVGQVYKSTNAGQSWTLIFSGENLGTGDYFYDIDVDPTNSNILYLAAHEHGFYKSTNAGGSFTTINNGISDLSSRSFVINPSNPALLFGGVWHGAGIYRSADSGMHWSQMSAGLPADVEVYRLVLAPEGGSNRPVYACTYENGLYRSGNNGASWDSAGLNGQFLYDFAIAPGSPQHWYAGLSYRGLYCSTSSGVNWAPCQRKVSSASITGLAALSSQQGQVYAGVYGRGVLRTGNLGQSWSEVNTGLTDFLVTSLVVLGNTLYALTPSGVFTSGGESWTKINNPITGASDFEGYQQFVLERASEPEEQLEQILAAELDANAIEAGSTPLVSLTTLGGTLYGGTAGSGLWRYTGSNWAYVGLSGYSVISLAADAGLGRLLLSACDPNGVCTVRGYKNGSFSDLNQGLSGLRTYQVLVRGDDYFAATTNGIYIRDNNGAQWILAGAAGKNMLSVSYATQNACLMAAGGGGVTYKSTNCGTVWQLTTSELDRWSFQAALIDPANPNRLIFGSKEAGAFLWQHE